MVRTDAGGLARFDWIATNLEEGTQFLATDRAYHCPRTPWIDLAHPGQPRVARLLRATRVTGRVFSADGNSAAGVRLRAEGRGRTNFYYRCDSASGPDSTYEFLVWPDQSYLIAILDDARAARTVRGLVIREGDPAWGSIYTSWTVSESTAGWPWGRTAGRGRGRRLPSSNTGATSATTCEDTSGGRNWSGGQ
ncbi:MAG: blaR [Gemmataceae bacterium]|nr:blaR [Gemmataceae bacterium]